MHTRMIDDEIKMMRQENLRLSHEREQMVDKIADNSTKVKQNKVLPYLVSKVVEVRRVSIERCLRGGTTDRESVRYWMSTARRRKARHIMNKTRRRANVQ